MLYVYVWSTGACASLPKLSIWSLPIGENVVFPFGVDVDLEPDLDGPDDLDVDPGRDGRRGLDRAVLEDVLEEEAESAERVAADEGDLGRDDDRRGRQEVDLLPGMDGQVARQVEDGEEAIDVEVDVVELIGPVEVEPDVPLAGHGVPCLAVVLGVGAHLDRAVEDELVGVDGDVARGPEQVDLIRRK